MLQKKELEPCPICETHAPMILKTKIDLEDAVQEGEMAMGFTVVCRNSVCPFFTSDRWHESSEAAAIERWNFLAKEQRKNREKT